MTKKIVLLTGSELRHDFVRKVLAGSPGIDMVAAYCEGREGSLAAIIDDDAPGAEHLRRHSEMRDRSERDFFEPFVQLMPDRSNPVHIPKGQVDTDDVADAIESLNPDLILAFGCSLVRGRLLPAFAGRFLNVHLGLSPYYRGSGTNVWALVNGEPECFGATFMHIDAGIDTGAIVHQMRARIFPGDSPNQIGNRLIADMAAVYGEIVRRFDVLEKVTPPPTPDDVKVYKLKDFTAETVVTLYGNFQAGLVDDYLAASDQRNASRPIAENPALLQGGRDGEPS